MTARRASAGRLARDDGALARECQGCHALALAFGLVLEALCQSCADRIAGMARENGGRLDAGFLGMPRLLDVLCGLDREEVAEALLMQDLCPSWRDGRVGGLA